MQFCSLCNRKKKHSTKQMCVANSETLAESTKLCRKELVNIRENAVLCPLVLDFLVDLMKLASSVNSNLYKGFDSFLTANGAVLDSDKLRLDLGRSDTVKIEMFIAGNTGKWQIDFKNKLDNSKKQ